MTRIDTRSFPARPASIGEALAFVEARCGAAGVAHDDALRLVLVTEELFTNTVMHGHGGGADESVQITLQIDAAELQLDYSDGAPPFDPLAWLRDAPPPQRGDLAARRPGGLGLVLMAQMARRIDYRHEDGRNRLRVVLPRASPG